MKLASGLMILAGAALTWSGSKGQAAEAKAGTVVKLDGLASTAPAEWKAEEPSAIAKRFRHKQFRLPKVKGDKRDAEMIIFYFQGGGGSVKENVQRWKGMFNPPRGKEIDDVAKVATMKVSDVPVTYLDIHGTYKFKKAPFVPDAKAELLPDYRMVGVVFESKNGPYFFRLVGPAKTVAHYKKGFDHFLKSFK
jgi:hypothetical protein